MATVEEQRTMIAIQNINRKLPEVTLRDLFAMSALNSLIQINMSPFDKIAKFAYCFADAMLEARKQ